jgi:alkanesulfonate monooxygenase SsuD/methylene tetrahydromethanopterin reductase-like flavin-dependent oxidoreductase (luciferase family)
MNLGVLVESEEGLTWERWRAIVALVERLGFESLWISDHHQAPRPGVPRGIDPWLALGVAAAETRRVRLGTLVSPITFYEPAQLARMSSSLRALSHDRFVLGLGLGWNRAEHVAHGIAFPPLAQRVERFRQTVNRLRASGTVRDVPLLIGGMGDSALPLVAQLADEWNLTTASVERYQVLSRAVAAHAVLAGRDPARIRRSVAIGFLVGRNSHEVRERSRLFQRVVPELAKHEVDAVAKVARDIGWVTGTPEEIVADLRKLARAGIQRAMLGHYLKDDDDALELITTQVMPELRSD